MKKVIILLSIVVLCGCTTNNNVETENKPAISDTIISEVIVPQYYSITTKEEYPLSAPDSTRQLNEKATKVYKKNTYYKVTKDDKLVILSETEDGKWAEIVHKDFPKNRGWIHKNVLKKVTENNISVINNDSSYETSSGYLKKEDYEPTVDDRGQYHTIDGKRKQIQYQGSLEQKKDLEEMKKRGY